MEIETEPSDTGFDLDAALGATATKMGLEHNLSGGEPETDEVLPDAEAPDVKADAVAKVDPAAPVVRAPPKSWAKEKHELWGKLPPDAQEYYETREKQMLDGIEQYKGDAGFAKQLRDIMSPYKPMLAAQGVTESDAIGYLFNAHYRLTTGSSEERAAAYRQIGADLGLVQPPEGEEVAIDPAVKQLRDELQQVKSTLSTEQQAKQREARSKIDAEVEVFASDPANVHYAEVAPDMVGFIKLGHSLAEAYKKAVWSNPVVREKELARIQTEAAAKLKETAKTEAEAARRATSANVRGQDSRRAPTEPKGTMDDTMRDTLKKIRDRAH